MACSIPSVCCSRSSRRSVRFFTLRWRPSRSRSPESRSVVSCSTVRCSALISSSCSVVDTPSAPRGPRDLMAPLRTTQDFPVRLHHRLQDLQPGRDAKAMDRFPDTVDHAEHPAGAPGSWRVASWGGVRTSSACHASPWVAVSFSDCIPCPTTGQGQKLPPASHQPKINSVRDIPEQYIRSAYGINQARLSVMTSTTSCDFRTALWFKEMDLG